MEDIGLKTVKMIRCFGDDLYFGLHGIRFICVCPGFVRTTMINREFLSPGWCKLVSI